MKRITLLEAPRLGQADAQDGSVLFGMYGGQPVQVTLEGEKGWWGVLIDQFGKEVPVLPVDGAHFQAFVDVAVSPSSWAGWRALAAACDRVSPEPGAEDAGTGAASGGSTVRRMGTRHS